MGRFAFRGSALAGLLFSWFHFVSPTVSAEIDTEALVLALAMTNAPYAVRSLADAAFRRAGHVGPPSTASVRDEIQKFNSTQWLQIAGQPRVLDKVIYLLGLDRAILVQRELLDAFSVPRSAAQERLLAAFSRVMTERCLAAGGVSFNPILMPFLATVATGLLTSLYSTGGVAAGADFPVAAVTGLSVLAGAIAGVAEWAARRGMRAENGARLTAVLGQTAAFDGALTMTLAKGIQEIALPGECHELVLALGRQTPKAAEVF